MVSEKLTQIQCHYSGQKSIGNYRILDAEQHPLIFKPSTLDATTTTNMFQSSSVAWTWTWQCLKAALMKDSSAIRSYVRESRDQLFTDGLSHRVEGFAARTGDTRARTGQTWGTFNSSFGVMSWFHDFIHCLDTGARVRRFSITIVTR